MNITFEIDKPISDSNYFVIGIKYLVLYIALFFTSWILIPLVLTSKRPSRFNSIVNILTDNIFLTNCLILLTLTGWFLYRFILKQKYGEVYKFSFDDINQELSISSINTTTNNEKIILLKYEALTLKQSITENALMGKQRVIQILEKNKVVAKVNIERTAWCRHVEIKSMLIRLSSLNKIPLTFNK